MTPEEIRAERLALLRADTERRQMFMEHLRERLEDDRRRIREATDAKTMQTRPRAQPIRARRLPGRNAPCPCGSGEKFKRCCMVRLKQTEGLGSELSKRVTGYYPPSERGKNSEG